MSRGARRRCGGALRVGSGGVLSVLPWQRINQQPEAATAPLPPLTPRRGLRGAGESQRAAREARGAAGGAAAQGRPRARPYRHGLGAAEKPDERAGAAAPPRTPRSAPPRPASACLQQRLGRVPVCSPTPLGRPAASGSRRRQPEGQGRFPGHRVTNRRVPKMRSRVPLMSSTGAANICG